MVIGTIRVRILSDASGEITLFVPGMLIGLIHAKGCGFGMVLLRGRCLPSARMRLYQHPGEFDYLSALAS